MSSNASKNSLALRNWLKEMKPLVMVDESDMGSWTGFAEAFKEIKRLGIHESHVWVEYEDVFGNSVWLWPSATPKFLKLGERERTYYALYITEYSGENFEFGLLIAESEDCESCGGDRVDEDGHDCANCDGDGVFWDDYKPSAFEKINTDIAVLEVKFGKDKAKQESSKSLFCVKCGLKFKGKTDAFCAGCGTGRK
jgi:hypothetical protein